MIARVLIWPDSYHDSVSLMAISRELLALPGVENAMVGMGTPMNKELLKGVGLLTPAAAMAGAADLVIAVGAATRAEAEAAIERAGEMLARRRPVAGGAAEAAQLRTIAEAVKADPDATLALISVPGAYAAREARLALEQGLDVMLYSDNVSIADEVALKRLAVERGLLLMGPDCGTAIIDGVGLGFANVVRRGPIGIVAASGTGAQELCCLIDRLGSGISQVIGTGGRDGTAAVGGLMLLEGLKRLQADPATEVIVVVSKPPAESVAAQIRQRAEAGSKPVVTCFVGEKLIDVAALEAVARATGEYQHDVQSRLLAGVPPSALRACAGRSRVLGLFSGGTLCAQARWMLGGHRELLDLGDDQYTVGRPHPMIDPTLRIQKLREAVSDPDLAVILLDVVLGHGAHPDPAGALAPAIREAVAAGVAVVASVTGTEADPQCLSAQEATLQAAGAEVRLSAFLAVLNVAAEFGGAKGGGGRDDA